MGETEITSTPQRVVVLDNISYEILWLLGVEPVGVSDLEVRKGWYPEISLSSNVADVGFSHEPNLEAIAKLEPDLILGWQHLNSNIYGELNEIAPTLLFDQFHEKGGPDALEATKNAVIGIAYAMNRHDGGVEIIEKMESKFNDVASKLASSGLKDKKVVMIDASIRDGNPRLRLYAPNSLPVLTLEKLGLVNIAPAPEEFSRFGSSTISLEVLSTLDDDPDTLLLYAQLPNNDPAPVIFKDNPVWKNLSFVKEGRTYNLGEINMFAGPIQIEKFADAVGGALTSGSKEIRVIKHAMGETEIIGTPKRVVALEWIYAEDLLALGVQPVGVADIEDMKRWVNMKGLELDESVVEVGHRWEPNLETLAQLEPDLIIGHVSNNAAIYEDLSKIAPTLIFNPDTSQEGSPGQLEEMRQTFMTIADVLGRHEKGVEVLERMDKTIADAAAKVSESGNVKEKFVLALGLTWEGETYIRVYANNAMAVEVMEQMGMENAWDVDRAFWGYSSAALEDLATVQDADFFYIAQDDDDIFATTYRDNAVWKNLNFVKEGRTYHLKGVVTPTGGPITAEIIAEAVAATVVGGNQ